MYINRLQINNYYIIIKYTLCIIVFYSTGYAFSADIGKYPIKNFTPVDYEGGIQNIYFSQNRDMTLYVANNLGILSFNGIEWEKHAFRTGKKQRSLAFDAITNRLYIGSQGEFGYFENDWNYVSLIDKIPKDMGNFDEVWDVLILDSYVYFCTFQGIYAFDGKSISVINVDEGLNKSFLVGNKIFTQNSNGKLFEISNLKLISGYQQNQSNQIVAGIIAKNDGYIIFYNSGQIEFLTPFGVEKVYPMLIDVLEGNYVNHVAQLSDTRLVISTQRSGLFLFNTQTQVIENISTENGLQSNACLRTYQDYSGNLWVGMQNGLALIDINSPMRLLNQQINLQGSGYEAYDSDKGTYFTTSSGIYFLANGAAKCTFLKGTEGPAYGIQQVQGKLYAGHHTGLFLLDEGNAKRISTNEGMWQVKQLNSNPKYAIGGTYTGLYLFKVNENQELEGIQKINGFGESSRFFEEDKKGRIWVGQFYKGLYKLNLNEAFTDAEVINVSDSNSLPINEHIILSKIDNDIYIATEEGIYYLDQTTDQIVEAKGFSEFVGKSWVYLLEQGSKKNIHVYTDNQVGYFKQVSKSNYAYVPSSLFQIRHSFNNDLLKVSVNVDNGIIFNANEGFIHYYPELEDRFNNDKQPLISKVYGVAEDSVLYERLPFEDKNEVTGLITISEGFKVLQFQVESFNFNNTGNLNFRYFLKGFDPDYGQWTNAPFKEYSNLKAGRYEFLVESVNSFGENITSLPIILIVEPPFHKSTFMKVLYIVLILLIIFQIYRYQKQYYKGKQNKIDKARLQELSQKQKELQRLKEEKTESELSHVNNLLAASAMNLVVKNEFIENIKEELKEVNQKVLISERRKALDKIVKEIDKTLKIHEDWQQFEHHFDRVHGDFLTRLTLEFTDLTHGEQKLCAFLRLKMDTKEISNLMAISLRGVEVARYRLRKKFNLRTNQNLSKYILEY